MTVRLRIEEDGDAREFVFDRSEISVGCGAFNDVVLGDEVEAEVHGHLHVDDSSLSFACAVSGVPTSVIREDACISTVGGDEETDLDVRVGDVIRIGAEPPVDLTIVERTADEPASFETYALSEAETMHPGAKISSILWRATDAVSGDDVLESFLRSVAAVIAEVLEYRPQSLTLWFLADEGEVEDHIYQLDVPEAGASEETLFPGIYQRERAPLVGLGVDRQEIIDAVDDGDNVVVRSPNPDRASLCIPVGPDFFRGIIDVTFADLSDDADLERSAVAGSLVQPLGRNVLKNVAAEVEKLSLAEENRYFRERQRRHYLFKDLVCESEAMRETYQKVNDWVSLDSPVLIEGEAGSGKSLMARALHHLGPRSDGMFISLDCRALSDDVLDSELFGCVESELVGAVAPRKGVFELADNGTVFLEEVDHLSTMLQGKLLRVLKEGEVRRIGDAIGRQIGARLVASTHRDLAAMVERGAFRRDLYLLLQEHVLEVPPLRERSADILPLARVYLRKFAERYEQPCREFSDDVAERLETHEWLGNARELKAVVEAAVLKTDGEVCVREEHLSL